jgi:uncharacterized protein (DUF2336 family)
MVVHGHLTAPNRILFKAAEEFPPRRQGMSQSLQIIDELELALNSNSIEQHNSILKKVTALFLGSTDRITEEISSVFDDVILRLVDHVERRARAELSWDLAPVAYAPLNVVRRLASDDDIAIAGPVLARSPRLTDQNLVEVARTKGQSHLSKVAERAQLSQAVTDALIDRGNQQVVTKVASNAGARFSRTGMSMLVMRASGDDELTYAMSRRSDVSRRLFKRLLSYATEQARQRMLATSAPADREAINRVLAQLADQAGSQTISQKEYAAAQRLVHTFSQDTEQTRSKVLQFADGYRIAELVAAMSILSGVPIALVSRLICDTEPFGAMVMCKAIGLAWMVAHAVLNNLPGISEDREEKLGEMEEHYAHMSAESAERLLGYWQTCQAQ